VALPANKVSATDPAMNVVIERRLLLLKTVTNAMLGKRGEWCEERLWRQVQLSGSTAKRVLVLSRRMMVETTFLFISAQ